MKPPPFLPRGALAAVLLAATSGCGLMAKLKKAPPAPQYERLPEEEGKVGSSGGVDIAVKRIGYGPTVLVVNSGPGASHEVIEADLDPFTDDVRWLFYDQRGTGRSGTPTAPDGFALAAQLADIDALREASDLPKLDILAHGLGAVFAVGYASQHPDRVGRLMLVNPLVSAAHLKRAEEIRASRVTDGDKTALAKLEKSGLKKTAPERYREEQVAIALRIGTCRRDGPQPRGRSDEHRETAKKVLAALGEDFDLVKGSEAITAKTAIMMGRCSFLSQITVEELGQKIKGAELIVFEGSGVHPFVEEKDRFKSVLRRFFGSPPPPAGTSP